MSDQDTIFEEETPTSGNDKPVEKAAAPTEKGEVTTKFTLPDGVEEWIGEGRKYKDPIEALSSIPHKETHISKLEEENREMREALAKMKSMEDLVQEFRKAQKPDANTGQPSPVTPESIRELVNEAIEARATQATLQQNGKTVADRLVAEYGDQAKARFNEKAQELGLPVAELHALARRSPTATLTLFGLSASKKEPPKTVQPSSNPNLPTQKDGQRISPFASGKTADVLAAWRQSSEKARQKLGVN